MTLVKYLAPLKWFGGSIVFGIIMQYIVAFNLDSPLWPIFWLHHIPEYIAIVFIGCSMWEICHLLNDETYRSNMKKCFSLTLFAPFIVTLIILKDENFSIFQLAKDQPFILISFISFAYFLTSGLFVGYKVMSWKSR